jgi:hypothetical protein
VKAISPLGYIAFIIFTIFVPLAFLLDGLLSQSVDFAHHYALIYRLEQVGYFTPLNDPSLWEMNFYPRGSHVVASALGIILGSPLLGLQGLALISVFAQWIFIFFILREFGGPENPFPQYIFLGLITINSLLFDFELVGREIVGDFFFAQLVSQTLMFGGIWFALRIRVHSSIRWAHLSLALLAVFLLYVHPLPALILIGMLCIDVFFTVLKSAALRTAKPLDLPVIFSLGVTLCILALNPQFQAMRGISENDGYLEIENLAYPFDFFILVALVALCSGLLIASSWSTRSVHSRIDPRYFLALLGLSTSFLLVFQFFLVDFGEGSSYAVKKYGFILMTILFIQIAVILANLISAKSTSFRALVGLGSSKWLSPLYGIFVALLVLLPLGGGLLSTTKLVELERSIESVMESSTSISSFSTKGVVYLESESGLLNYMYSIAITQTPREHLHDLLFSNTLSRVMDFAFVVTLDKQYAVHPECVISKLEFLTSVDSNCLASD